MDDREKSRDELYLSKTLWDIPHHPDLGDLVEGNPNHGYHTEQDIPLVHARPELRPNYLAPLPVGGKRPGYVPAVLPILFHIGSFPIHTYGALGAAAFLIGAGISLWRGTRLGLDKNHIADVIFWMAVTGLLGARITFVLQNPAGVHDLAALLDLRGGGLVFYGALVVGLPVGFVVMQRYSLPAFAVWDLFGTAFPVAHAISRVGCFAAGCCFGSPTDSSWAVIYPDNHPIAPGGIPVHPVQLYEAVALSLIGLATNLFYRYRRFDGQVFLLYLLLYAAVRPGLEILRGDIERGWFLPSLLGETLTWSQGMSAVFAVVALSVFFYGARTKTKRFSAPKAAIDGAPRA